jgi:hypothetical protein
MAGFAVELIFNREAAMPEWGLTGSASYSDEWLLPAQGCRCRTRQHGPVSDLKPAVGAWLQDDRRDAATEVG